MGDGRAGALFNTYAAFYGRVERSFFYQIGGLACVSLKKRERSLVPRFGLTAREFRPLWVPSSKERSLRSAKSGPISLRKLGNGSRRAETAIGELEDNQPRPDVLHEKKRRLAIFLTKLDAHLTDQRSRTDVSLFRFAPPLPVKSFPWKRTPMRIIRLGIRIGRWNGAASSLCSARGTRPLATSPAKPRYLFGGEPIGLALRLPEG